MNFGNKNYISYKQQDVVQLGGAQGDSENKVPVLITIEGPAQLIGAALKKIESTKEKSIGIMVAGNSGRPGGHIGGWVNDKITESFVEDPLTGLNGWKGGQEEDIMRTWLLSYMSDQRQEQFNKIAKQWGLDNKENNDTIQTFNYVTGGDREIYSKPDILVENAQITPWETPPKQDQAGKLDESRTFNANLVFVAGPNASTPDPKKLKGSTARTANTQARTNYDFFKEGIKVALKTAFDKLNDNDIKIVFVAGISTGIYAGTHKDKISKEFIKLVQDVLEQNKSTYKFEYVVFPRYNPKNEYPTFDTVTKEIKENLGKKPEELKTQVSGINWEEHRFGYGYGPDDVSTTMTAFSSNRIPYPDYLIMSLKDLKEVFKLAQKYDLTTSSTNVNEEDKKLVTNLIQKYSSVYKLTEDGVNHLTISTPP